MVKYTKEEINKIINLKGANGKLIDIFSLHGVIYFGNCIDGMWDLTSDGQFTRFSEHSVTFSIDDFDYCTIEEEVNDTFFEVLKRNVVDRLL